MLRSFRRQRRAASVEPLEVRALLTTFTVTSLDDTVADDGQTTLREAINQAIANGSDDDIVFADGLSGVIGLTSELDLGSMPNNDELTITGNGRNETIIDAQGNSDIFTDVRQAFSLTSLTLRNAQNRAIDFRDGFYIVGEMRIEDSVITGSGGNAIRYRNYQESLYLGSLTIADSVITNNTGRGLSVLASVHVTIEDSVISGNAGGIAMRGSYDGTAPRVTLKHSAVQDNIAPEDGGGILIEDGTLILEDSLISGNEATNGGGIGMTNGEYPTFRRSTISGNMATADGGGMFINQYRYGTRSFENLTITGNSASRGGGAFITSSNVNLRNSTLTDNTATVEGGGIFFGVDHEGRLESTVVAENTAPSAPDLRVQSSSRATVRNNFIGSNQGSDLTATGTTPDENGNFVGSSGAELDPLLSPEQTVGLQNIRRPQEQSLLVNRGNNHADLATDQVGISRDFAGGVDIGAVEAVPGQLLVDDLTIVEANDGTTTATFIIELLEATDAFTIDVRSVDGTALAGSDYQSITETLSFAGTIGEQKQVAVQIIGDTDLELNETFRLTFENVSDPAIALPGDVEATILNNDESETVQRTNGTIRILGTSNADVIDLVIDSGYLNVRLNSEAGSFAADSVHRIVVRAGDGDDLVSTTMVDDRMEVFGEGGDDTLAGGSGNDELRGGPGNDRLDAGSSGRDSLWGDAGDDLLVASANGDTLKGGDGNDTLRGGDGSDELRGDGGDDEVDGEDGGDRISGGAGNDTLRGGEGRDRIAGGGGNDLLNGGTEDDRIGGGSGRDTLNGGRGDDYLNAGRGPDLLAGGDDNDTLLAREGDDVLLGENGDDELVGWTGRDIVYGGAGADIIEGRGHDDILVAGTVTPTGGLSLRDFLAGSIRDEWLSGRTYQQRVANVRDTSGGTNNRKNTEFLIGAGRSGQTVFDDSAVDNITGGGSNDLFYLKPGSDLSDQTGSELFEAL